MSPRFQRTISGSATVQGFGYWSSLDVMVQFAPAPPDTGIVFVRSDLPGQPRVPALERCRFDVPRRTNLQCGHARVDMVEHVLAALAGLQIDNCEVWCDAVEMPGPDGSSRPFVEALDRLDVVEQDVLRRQLIVTETVRMKDAEHDVWVEVEPYDGYRLEYELDFGDTPIGIDRFGLDVTPETFRTELANARTFILKQEADWLRQQNLGLRATNQDLLVFDDDGPIENQLRFENECVRHKTLDMLGDFALTGCDILGKITAHRSGHKLNARMARQLLSLAAQASSA